MNNEKIRKVLLIVFSFGILIVLLMVVPSNIRDILNPNSIIVNTKGEIDLSRITIIWGDDPESGKLIYANKKDLNKKYKEYGKNFFCMKYQDSLIAKFYQFKTNNWHGHTYTFNLVSSNDSILVNWTVNGPDSEKVFKIYPDSRNEINENARP